MEEINTVILEDNIRYIILDKIEKNNNKYIYLSNIDTPEDFCIRKMVKENNQEMLLGLDNKNEFELALLYYTQKHNN